MKILVAGNLGYIGSSVVNQLRSTFPDAQIIGFDIAYFAHCLTNADYSPEVVLDAQYFGDIRKFPEHLLRGVDVVLNLAAVSNDPMGKAYEDVTIEVNYKAAVRLATLSKQNGVRKFVYASSCSMYGEASDFPKKEDDALNPLTAYARSKVAAELELKPLADDSFNITCLRFATACGFTSRLRLDLVLNDFVAGALLNKEIVILSDGSPWRPMINTKDMARAFEWAVLRENAQGGNFLAVNTGSNEWNNQIEPLAVAVAEQIPGVKVTINKVAQPDKRSYQVNFDLYKSLAPNHQPIHDLASTIKELKENIAALRFLESDFRKSKLIRLKVLDRLQEMHLLDKNLEWVSKCKRE